MICFFVDNKYWLIILIDAISFRQCVRVFFFFFSYQRNTHENVLIRISQFGAFSFPVISTVRHFVLNRTSFHNWIINLWKYLLTIFFHFSFLVWGIWLCSFFFLHSISWQQQILEWHFQGTSLRRDLDIIKILFIKRLNLSLI